MMAHDQALAERCVDRHGAPAAGRRRRWCRRSVRPAGRVPGDRLVSGSVAPLGCGSGDPAMGHQLRRRRLGDGPLAMLGGVGMARPLRRDGIRTESEQRRQPQGGHRAQRYQTPLVVEPLGTAPASSGARGSAANAWRAGQFDAVAAHLFGGLHQTRRLLGVRATTAPLGTGLPITGCLRGRRSRGGSMTIGTIGLTGQRHRGDCSPASGLRTSEVTRPPNRDNSSNRGNHHRRILRLALRCAASHNRAP